LAGRWAPSSTRRHDGVVRPAAGLGVDSINDAWRDDVTERIRQGHEVVVGEHDGSVDAGEDQDG
jgi:hypothetical protein